MGEGQIQEAVWECSIVAIKNDTEMCNEKYQSVCFMV